MRSRVAGLSRELAGVFDQPLVGRDPHAAAGGGDDLVAVGGEDALQVQISSREIWFSLWNSQHIRLYLLNYIFEALRWTLDHTGW